jgi:hypothetical protein
MPVDASKVKLGPCKITWDVDNATPTVFEMTKGVVLNFSQSTKVVTIDQTGESAIKEIILGENGSVEVGIAEHDLEKLSKIIPNATLVTNATDTTKKKIKIGKLAGTDLFSIAKKVKIEPIGGTAADTVVLLKAAPKVELSQNFNLNDERLTKVVFMAYADAATGALMEIGDPTA